MVTVAVARAEVETAPEAVVVLVGVLRAVAARAAGVMDEAVAVMVGAVAATAVVAMGTAAVATAMAAVVTATGAVARVVAPQVAAREDSKGS